MILSSRGIHISDIVSQVKSSDPRSCTPFIPHHDKEKGSGFDTIFAGSLERQPWAFCLLFLYAIIAVPSWTIICWLSYRPIGISAYDDTHNALFTSFADWNHSDRCRRAANVGLSIIAAVGIPVTSAICAKATVIYCQMKSNGKPPSLTMRQTLALADKGWSDLGVIWDLIHPTGRRRTRSPLLLFSVFLVGLGINVSLPSSEKNGLTGIEKRFYSLSSKAHTSSRAMFKY